MILLQVPTLAGVCVSGELDIYLTVICSDMRCQRILEWVSNVRCTGIRNPIVL